MRHERITGWLLIVTGGVHSLIGAVSGREALVAMAHEGLWQSARASLERQQVVWFLMTGFMFVVCGLLALGSPGPLPRSFGWALGLVALLGTFLFGASGFVLLISQALYVLLAPRGRDGAGMSSGIGHR